MWEPPAVQPLAGDRLHLQHGPIDLVLRAWGAASAVREAYDAAIARFQTVLPELVGELAELRKPMAEKPQVEGPVAQRMVAACRPHAGVFVTPMAAVAGSVADEILEVMVEAAPLDRAFVNDGGDIAVHLTEGETLDVALAADFSRGPIPSLNGRLSLSHGDGIGGIATSGAQGRSFSLGIADSVTILARDAASADVAATLVANAVDADHPAVERRPATALDPDSDLGDRLVTTAVGSLPGPVIAAALAAGLARAEHLQRRGLIFDAALVLQGESRILGKSRPMREIRS
ncbi:UPF0280 family protein [Phreatobacter oligotrophus]|uniref:Thiamine biosynthesis protein ApbE n=1 Tax=Phreatobacter oligotrophus TaxID=1122261 RepID=A0A2T4ZFS6_9HYPH|nr:UPF0280 family protein [Phreatobacter oligotrophus]PTM60763.1 hypothetical protein C8P69_102145 [Phreatobacter oligotrophus]